MKRDAAGSRHSTLYTRHCWRFPILPALAAASLLLASGCGLLQFTPLLALLNPEGKDREPPRPPAPDLLSVFPQAGQAAGGTHVNLTGINFQAGATVTFDALAATNVVVVNQNSITCDTPAHAAGPVDAVVTNPDGQSDTMAGAFTYTVVPGPDVLSVNPTSGPTAGGTAVTVTGTNFQSSATVSFGGTAATGVTFVNATTITCTTPGHAGGQADVVVQNPDLQADTLANGFTFVPPPDIVSINPTSGPTAGGTAVTITGTGFQAGATVTFGGTAGTGVSVPNATTITCTTPAHAAGAADVVVVNPSPSTNNSDTLANGFTFVPPPDVISVNPTSGSTAGGTSVTISGTDFQTGATVTFGGTAATGVSVPNSTAITCTTPAHAAGAADLVVQNQDSQSDTVLNAFTFSQTGGSWVATQPTGAPSARWSIASVWTGREMIVWGGQGSSGDSSTGGRYDPVLNAWTATNVSGSPSARHQPISTWTGRVMIVWGGAAGTLEVGGGGRYDPISDSWSPTSATGAPSVRCGHTMVWTGREMILWGGWYQGSNYNDGYKYDPNSDIWSSIATLNAPSTRNCHEAVWTGRTMVIWGGVPVTNTGGRYDPVANSWQPTSTTGAPQGRRQLSSAWTGRQAVFWGGYDDTTSSVVNTGGRYDPISDSWQSTNLSGAPSARTGFAGHWTGRMMIVWGGSNGSSYFDQGGAYDPVADTWSTISSSAAISPRSSFASTWTGREMIVWGGYDGTNYLGSGGRYEPPVPANTDTWTATQTTGAPTARAYHTSVWTGKEMIVWGGAGGSDLNTGGRYDPISDSWNSTTTSSAPTGRQVHTAIWTGKEMIVWGGGSPQYNTGARYDPVSDSWAATSTTNVPSARSAHVSVWTGREMIVWGGWPGAATNTGGRYDPRADSWVPTSTGSAASPRYDFRAVWTGREMIVWGGTDGSTRFNTGGRYDPVNDSWLPTSTSSPPSAREDHCMIWTGREMIVWGGIVGITNTGGRYDPVSDSWLGTATSGAPTARGRASAIWTGRQMVVWGGYDGTSTVASGGKYDPASDTWSATSGSGAPSAREFEYQTSIWTGREMIVWGGDVTNQLNTGGRYVP